MRQFRFRAWNEEDGLSMPFDIWSVQLWEEEELETTIMQYTGCNDRNGKEIYESDLVRIDGKWVREIVYQGSSFIPEPAPEQMPTATISTLGFYDASELEVIGNTYETPELLK